MAVGEVCGVLECCPFHAGDIGGVYGCEGRDLDEVGHRLVNWSLGLGNVPDVEMWVLGADDEFRGWLCGIGWGLEDPGVLKRAVVEGDPIQF